jgi:hypothetical protein
MAVVCPHLELMDAARKQREDAKESLSNAFSYDSIHLTFAGYAALIALIWNAMMQNFYRLMPAPNMLSPQTIDEPLQMNDGYRSIPPAGEC